MCTPGRPLPVFVEETFSARKRTPFRAQYTPRSPAKSCPPVSRISRSGCLASSHLPRVVSFKSERKTNGVVVESPHYQPLDRGSYFDQCFEVMEKIGQGSFGEVFKVRSKDDGRLYAVKRCWERFRGSTDRRQKLEEVERHETLATHPNCVQFVNAWEERGLLYIQTELCQMSLAQYADLHGRLSEDRVWNILSDLLQAVDHLHSHQLGHFDIKPSNIFLASDGSCKLGDFGLCVSLNQTLENAIEGDARYMARELMRRQFSKAADIFSLGISMLELVCDLELPSGGDNWHKLRDGILPQEFTDGVSPQLMKVIHQMMSPLPEHRPSARHLLSSCSRLHLSSVRSHCSRLSHTLTTTVQWMTSPLYRPLLLLFLYLLSWWRVQRSADEVSVSPSQLPPTPFIGPADNSFSDDEEEMVVRRSFLSTTSTTTTTSDDGTKAQLNCSYVSTSPARYPGYFYSGPPIPINLDEGDSSAAEGTPSKQIMTSCSSSSSSSESSSQNNSFSFTPNSKPLLSREVERRSASNRSLSVGPKNLMEMFLEAGD